MKFEEVLPSLRQGKKIRRTSWGKDILVELLLGKILVQGVDIMQTYDLDNDDILGDDWEIVKEKKKVKLRDLTKKQYKTFVDNKCENQIVGIGCVDCPFYHVSCLYGKDTKCWIDNKNLYSDKFLDQEIEVGE